jgi:hypothetical protein
MIRIEGIPAVAARLADAQKRNLRRAGNKRSRKIDAGGEGPLAVHPTLHSKMKAA